MKALPQFINEFFSAGTQLDENNLFMTRSDGVLLYTNNRDGNEQATGALISGLWQAAKAITDFIPVDQGGDVFRLSFDTTSKGLYICPILLHNEEYFLGVTYAGQVNPGQLKLKIKRTALLLSEFIIKKGQQKKSISEKRENFLFSNISDDEMDKLFLFARE